MSPNPSLQERIEDPDLRRRMAWGLIGGRTKAEIAAAEGLTLDECQAILEQPGTYMLFNVWTLLLYHRHTGGPKHLMAVVRWTLDYILLNAPSCAVGRGVGLVTIIATFFKLRCAGTLRTLFACLDAATGRGALPKRLGSVRRKLVETMAWGIETALIDQLAQSYDDDLLASLDRRFRAALAKGEIADMDPSILSGEPEAAPAEEPSKALVAPELVRPVLRIVSSIETPSPVLRPRPHEPGLHDCIRYKRRRKPLPPLVQPRLIERAA